MTGLHFGEAIDLRWRCKLVSPRQTSQSASGTRPSSRVTA